MFLKTIGRSILAFLFLFAFKTVGAQNNFWSDVPEASQRSSTQKRVIIPNKYRTLKLDTAGLLGLLKSAPKEFTTRSRTNPTVLTVPMPDGSFQSFSIVQTSIMEPGLAAQFPNLRTFGGQGIDDRSATIKLDWTPLGFHATILSASGTFSIDPYARGTIGNYIAYSKKDINPRAFNEEVIVAAGRLNQPENLQRLQAACVGGTLRSYRLAVACTGEYGVAVGATTKEQALAAIVTTVNRVNGVYERELAVRLVLVATNIKIVFVNPSTDPFSQNDNGSGLLDESQEIITDSIGSANYDIGHTFSTGGGGVAGLGVVCDNSSKASGITGQDEPTGDPYDIDFVAHEIGHQFGAEHTFNAITSNCGGGNREPTTAVEPGSGSTIMGYAGICTSNDLQPNSDPYFHSISFNQINSFVEGDGSACVQLINTGNTPPVVNAGNNYTIPLSTPFTLTGLGLDPDGHTITYSWEQIDLGPSGNWNSPSGNAPIFRSFTPTLSPSRTFPAITNLLNNTVKIGEILPSYARNLNFRLTARDNRSGGGGQCSDEMSVTVASSGPFVLTSPNTATTWEVGSFKTITWNVANTNNAPVNCANVNISLSTDGGLTFPIVVAESTPNDGSHEIRVPDNVTANARIRIMAVDNIFFDLSNVNFTILTSPTADFVFNDPAPVVECAGTSASAFLSTGSLGGFSNPITLTASGNPAGSTVLFSENPVNAIDTTTITVQNLPGPGTYNITITGTSGAIVKTKVLVFQVGIQPISLTAPANNSVGVGVSPQFSWQAAEGASTYDLLIASNSTFTDTVQSIINIATNTFKLATPLAEDTRYFWRVTARNICGIGQPSAGFSFITAVTICGDTLYSTNVPVVIPETASTITSTINIPAGGIVADIDVVGLKGTHTYISDLSFTLTSPAGTTVRLFGGVCGSRNDFDLNLNDEAAAGAIACPATGGQVRRPAQPLSAFDNQSVVGTWTLAVKDSVEVDDGSLTKWGLKICTLSPVYTFIGNGSWTDAANWKNNAVPPLLLPTGSQIVIDPSSGSCILDVAQVIAQGATISFMPGKSFVVNVSLTFQ